MCGQKTEKEATELAAIIKKQTFTLDMLRPFAGSIAPVYTAAFAQAAELGDTQRGAGGFGSTGR